MSDPTPPTFPGPIDPPELTVPLPPPEVGEGSPWAPADGENRDRILDWWRAWWRRVFFPWLAAFLAWLNAWLAAAEQYIIDHAKKGDPGRGWWTTATVISATGQTTVLLPADPSGRLPQVGDFVSDQSSALRYGEIVAIVDATHATVTPLGVLRGLAGFGWWTTATPIAHTGTTDVVLATGPDRQPQINDLVVDETEQSAYGEITAVADATHVTVAYIGTLQGPVGVADLGEFDFTTPVLAAGDTYQGQMAGQPSMVGAFTVSGDAPCWIRVYASQAYMLADEAREILTPLDIAADHGCYLDFVGILSELSKTLTPGVQITDLGSGVWLSVRNTDVSESHAVAVHMDYRIFRA